MSEIVETPKEAEERIRETLKMLEDIKSGDFSGLYKEAQPTIFREHESNCYKYEPLKGVK